MIAGGDAAAWVGAAGAILGGLGAAVAAYFAYRSAAESAKVGEHAVLVERLGRYDTIRTALKAWRPAGNPVRQVRQLDVHLALRASDELAACQVFGDPGTSTTDDMLDSALAEIEAAITRTEAELTS